MVSPTCRRMSNIQQELNRRQTIPTDYHDTLEKRLAITFKPPPSRLERRKTRRDKKEYKLKYNTRKAQKVYVEILEDYPHIFVPFILSVSPDACQRLDLEEFRKSLDITGKVDLGDDAQAILDSIAKKIGFDQSRLYQRLRKSLFSPVSKPLTSAETGTFWDCRAANWDAIRNIFDEHICSAIENSSKWMQEAKCRALQVTECVWMKLPKQNYQDAIISLEVSVAEELVKALFPSTYEEILALVSIPSTEDVTRHNEAVALSQLQKPMSSEPYHQDGTSRVFQAAHTSGIPLIFGPRIAEAIEKSQLREWEKHHSFLETTDCVSLKVYSQQPANAVFHLRIGFVAGTYIARTLYA
ncbi:hypothetical protein BDW60DRAFT_201170 [Aspergillus nidulans var. acristatus]